MIELVSDLLFFSFNVYARRVRQIYSQSRLKATKEKNVTYFLMLQSPKYFPCESCPAAAAWTNVRLPSSVVRAKAAFITVIKAFCVPLTSRRNSEWQNPGFTVLIMTLPALSDCCSV